MIGALPDLITEYPLAEPLECLLMEALHAAGRDAEAIDRYAVVRERLAEALGADPGQELRTVYEAILRGEPLAAATGATAQRGQTGTRRAEPATGAVAARGARIRRAGGAAGQLDALAGTGPDAPGAAVVIAAIAGWPGSARPRWRCTGRTGSPTGSRTASST